MVPPFWTLYSDQTWCFFCSVLAQGCQEVEQAMKDIGSCRTFKGSAVPVSDIKVPSVDDFMDAQLLQCSKRWNGQLCPSRRLAGTRIQNFRNASGISACPSTASATECRHIRRLHFEAIGRDVEEDGDGWPSVAVLLAHPKIIEPSMHP